MDAEREICHARDRFQNRRVMGRRRGIRSPGERAVVGHQHARSLRSSRLLQAVNDRMAGVSLVVRGDLMIGHLGSYWHWTMEIVRVSRAKTRNAFPCLSPGSGIFRVRMSDPADFGKLLIQH